MAQTGEVADDKKLTEHVIPMDIWQIIRADAAKLAEEAAEDGR